MYYEASVRLERVQENGATRKVSEKYLCDAVCVSETELRVSESLRQFVSDEFAIKAIKETKIEEVINADSDRFYSVKYGIKTIDEKTGAEKMNTIEILVGAGDFDSAHQEFIKHTQGWVSDWELLSVGLSPIVEVIK